MKTPYYLIDEQLLEKNLKILYTVKERTGCKILLAQKCFSMFSVYPLIGKYLDGTTASGLFEAKLGHEEMKKENTSQTNVFETRKVLRFVIERRLVRIAEPLYSSAP